MRKYILIIWCSITAFSCQYQKTKDEGSIENSSFIIRLRDIPDSISVEEITVKNLFKSQLLANSENHYDTQMIANKVYYSHQNLWDSCYALIFGDENASKFNTRRGMIDWNRSIYLHDSSYLIDRAILLLQMNFDSAIRKSLNRFNELVPYKVRATISIVFTPMTGILFGGCSNDQFCIELNNKDRN